MTQTLSIKMAWRGRERYRLMHREISVDENYLVLNEGSTYGSSLKASCPAWIFAVFMRLGMHREVRAARHLSLATALEQPDPGIKGGEFSEHLRRHDAIVSPLQRHLCESVLDGERSEKWLEEQQQLLDAMFHAAALDGRAVHRLARARPSTRIELARRRRMAADFFESCYEEPIDLDRMARIVFLSRFHFVAIPARSTALRRTPTWSSAAPRRRVG